MRNRTMLLTLISILLAGGPVSLPAGQPVAFAHDEHDEDLALNAREAGEVIALDQVLAALGNTMPGEISEIELEREHGILIYEFKVISPDGQMQKIRVDAKTGKLIKPEG
jgi:uncharacterized membrane protein YkoI